MQSNWPRCLTDLFWGCLWLPAVCHIINRNRKTKFILLICKINYYSFHNFDYSKTKKRIGHPKDIKQLCRESFEVLPKKLWRQKRKKKKLRGQKVVGKIITQPLNDLYSFLSGYLARRPYKEKMYLDFKTKKLAQILWYYYNNILRIVLYCI